MDAPGYTMGIQRTSSRGQLTAALVCLLGLGNVVTSQSLQTFWDPVKTTCNMVFARAVVMKNTLYLDGGALVDQTYYRDGVDKPYNRNSMGQWQSECFSIQLSHNDPFSIIYSTFTESHPHISRSASLETGPFTEIQCLDTTMGRAL